MIQFLSGAASMGLCISLFAQRWDMVPYFGVQIVILIAAGYRYRHE